MPRRSPRLSARQSETTRDDGGEDYAYLVERARATIETQSKESEATAGATAEQQDNTHDTRSPRSSDDGNDGNDAEPVLSEAERRVKYMVKTKDQVLENEDQDGTERVTAVTRKRLMRKQFGGTQYRYEYDPANFSANVPIGSNNGSDDNSDGSDDDDDFSESSSQKRSGRDESSDGSSSSSSSSSSLCSDKKKGKKRQGSSLRKKGKKKKKKRKKKKEKDQGECDNTGGKTKTRLIGWGNRRWQHPLDKQRGRLPIGYPSINSGDCTNCRHDFEAVPWIPILRKHEVTGLPEFDDKEFCTLPCLLRYLEDHPGDYCGTSKSVIMYTLNFARQYMGLKANKYAVNPAPPLSYLRFGSMDIDTYRQYGYFVRVVSYDRIFHQRRMINAAHRTQKMREVVAARAAERRAQEADDEAAAEGRVQEELEVITGADDTFEAELVQVPYHREAQFDMCNLKMPDQQAAMERAIGRVRRPYNNPKVVEQQVSIFANWFKVREAFEQTDRGRRINHILDEVRTKGISPQEVLKEKQNAGQFGDMGISKTLGAET